MGLYKILMTAVLMFGFAAVANKAPTKRTLKRKPAQAEKILYCFEKKITAREKANHSDVDSVRLTTFEKWDGANFNWTGLAIYRGRVDYNAAFECYQTSTTSKYTKYDCTGAEDNGYFEYIVLADKSKATMKIKSRGLSLGDVETPQLNFEPRLKTIILDPCEDS